MGSGKGQAKRVSNYTNSDAEVFRGARSAASRRILTNAKQVVTNNASRVAKLGNWPDHISHDSLLSRLPIDDDVAPGFDAGIACALDLIPRDKQKLSASLHAAYTPELIKQVREETSDWDPESETIWWLAACGVCEEGGVTKEEFVNQVQDFSELINDEEKRVNLAKQTYAEMLSSFTIDEYGMPFARQDGGMQGAYIAGHNFSAMYADKYKLFFVGTILPSLNVENFDWEGTEETSGPVHGSKQFVKCANKHEYARLVKFLDIQHNNYYFN